MQMRDCAKCGYMYVGFFMYDSCENFSHKDGPVMQLLIHAGYLMKISGCSMLTLTPRIAPPCSPSFSTQCHSSPVPGIIFQNLQLQ